MMIADSDVLIDFLRGSEPGVSRIKLELNTGRLATTSANAFELLSGARSDRERAKVTALLDALTILPVDESAAALAASARRHLAGRGAGIGMADFLIAGVCLSHQSTLLTRNLEHFERVPNLNISGRHG